MLIQGDASALEWRCASFLSQDEVASKEFKYGQREIVEEEVPEEVAETDAT